MLILRSAAGRATRWLCVVFVWMMGLSVWAQVGKTVITVNVENDAVHRFMSEVTYTRDSSSRVLQYIPSDIRQVRYDHPRPAVIDLPTCNIDTLITTYRDTLTTVRIDTLVEVHCDTLYHVSVPGSDRLLTDTLVTIRVDSVFTQTETTTIAMGRDTLITIPADTLLLCYSLHPDLSSADTIRIDNGQPSVSVYNLIPHQTYYFQLLLREQAADSLALTVSALRPDSLLMEGEIHTKGRLRMIYAPSVQNIRDLGGYVNDDYQQIKYGMLYRGGELNGQHTADSVDIDRLKRLGIAAEIDLRYDGESDGTGISAFGFLSEDEVDDGEQPSFLFTNNCGCCDLTHLTYTYWRQRYKRAFNFIIDNIRQGRPVYYHCVWGSDRTGMISILMQGILGVSYSDMVKDIELSTFSLNYRLKENRDFIFDYFNSLPGATLKDKIRYYLLYMVGMKREDLDYFCKMVLTDRVEDEPDPEPDDNGDDVTVDIRDVDVHSTAAQPAPTTTVYDLGGRPTTETTVSKTTTIVVKKGKGIVEMK